MTFRSPKQGFFRYEALKRRNGRLIPLWVSVIVTSNLDPVVADLIPDTLPPDVLTVKEEWLCPRHVPPSVR